MEGMLKEGLAPIYSFADRSVTIGVRPEHYEVIAAVLPMALEVRAQMQADGGLASCSTSLSRLEEAEVHIFFPSVFQVHVWSTSRDYWGSAAIVL